MYLAFTNVKITRKTGQDLSESQKQRTNDPLSVKIQEDTFR